MDTKGEIKEEDPLSDNMASQNEKEFFHEVVTVPRNSDALLLEDDSNETVKSETPFAEHSVKQIKSETNNWEIDSKTEIEEQTLVSEFGSQNEGEFLPEDPVMKYDRDDGMKNIIYIKEEPCLLETETSSVCNDIKDGDFPPVKSPRLCIEAISGDCSAKSPLLSAEVSGRDTDFYNGKDCSKCETQKSDVTDMSTVEQRDHLEQSGKCSDAGEVHSKSLYLKQKSFINKSKKRHQCETCDKSFTGSSYLKIHNLIHEGKKPHQCKICDKSFTQLSHLKTHNLFHEDKKPYPCKTCDKSFTQLSHLKTHNLIHEGKKPYVCKSCDKSFTQLSHLKTHYLIHEGKKPYQCKTCDKRFTQLPNLKRHNLIHEDKKPHQCKTCNKRFTRLSSLRTHNLIHEGKKPYPCKSCDKSFTRLSHLKRHYLIHEGKKPQ